MTRRKRFIFFCLSVAVAGMGFAWLGDDAGDGVAYRTEIVTRGDITAVVTGTGALNPVHLVEVGTQVSGKVSKLYVKVNDQVKAGQVLAEIDPALLLAQIKQDRTSLETARAAYEQAKRDLERVRILLAKDYVAKVDLERAQQAVLSTKNNYESAQTAIERDEVNLSYATITSPIAGVVIARDVTEGQTLQATFQAPTMFKIAGNLAEMQIEVGLSEADIGKVKVGMQATFTVNAFPDKAFSGTVQSVNLSPITQQSVMASAVMYGVTVSVDNEERLLLPGMTAYVSVTLSQQKDVLRVPAAALRFTPPPQQVSGLRRLFNPAASKPAPMSAPGDRNLKILYVLRAGTAVPLPVAVGATDESYVAVAGKGIEEGDLVITGMLRPARGR